MYRMIILVVLCGFSGFNPVSSSVNPITEVKRVLHEKEEAVNQHNKKLFLSRLDPGNSMYMQEQKHWFDDAIVYMDAKSFRLRPIKIRSCSKDNVTIWVSQEYKHHGKYFNIHYPLHLKRTTQGWRDTDIDFHKKEKGLMTIYFDDEKVKPQARIALETVEKATAVLERKYNWRPVKIEVKLYHKQEVFRQSVKPSLPTWAGGWHESNQAIKFIGGIIDDASFSKGIIHELIHQMVSELTNDNAAYWLQEGAAMYYEHHLYGDPSLMPLTDSAYSLVQLEKTHLEKLPDKEADRYYASCYQLFKSLVKLYGEDCIGRMLTFLRAYPEIDVESTEKKDVLNLRTRKALERGKIRVLENSQNVSKRLTY